MKHVLILIIALVIALTGCKSPKTQELEKKVLDQEQALRIHHENVVKFYESLKSIQETEVQIDKLMESRKPNSVDVDKEILQKIEKLKEVVELQKKKITDMQKQVAYYKPFKQEAETLRKQVETFQMIIADKDKKIAEMEEAVKTLQTQNEQLSKENVKLVVATNTVYYTYGERDDLMQRGVVTKSGGNIFGGKTYLPVSDPQLYTSGDKRSLTTIDASGMIEKILPDRAADCYSITGNILEIKDTAAFWKNPYLVIMVKAK